MNRSQIVLLIAAALSIAGAGLRAPASGSGGGPHAIRALLVLGGCCHDYNVQRELISKGVSERANVEWTIAYDPDKGTEHKNPVYDSDEWAKRFDVVVHDECTSDVKDVPFIERILKPHKAGLPAVLLHCGMHSYRSEGWPKSTPWFDLTGLPTTGHGPQEPIAITFADHDNPITKGMNGWTTVREELYNNSEGKLLETARPLARGKQVYRDKNGQEITADCVCVWTNAYNGKTRVFATTLGHNNETVGDPRYLDLVTRGLLWSVNKLDRNGNPAAGYGPPNAR